VRPAAWSALAKLLRPVRHFGVMPDMAARSVAVRARLACNEPSFGRGWECGPLRVVIRRDE
jgi:hypothetical protein